MPSRIHRLSDTPSCLSQNLAVTYADGVAEVVDVECVGEIEEEGAVDAARNGRASAFEFEFVDRLGRGALAEGRYDPL